MRIRREWAMPPPDTFTVPPIAEFVGRFARGVIVDPFARNCQIGTITNDLNPETQAQYHFDARDFLKKLVLDETRADTVLFDPPYSPRQVTEVYQSVGRKVGMQETQTAVLYMECRRLISDVLKPGGCVLSFGWNSCGFGERFTIEEILLVAHGGAHNDTICVAHRKTCAELF